MDDKTLIWLCYAGAAFITLAAKFGAYLSGGVKLGKPVKVSATEWFFEKSCDNLASWVGTIGFVWLFGYLFIEKAAGALDYFFPMVKAMPVKCPVAFFLGYIAEMKAPDFCKWFMRKFIVGETS